MLDFAFLGWGDTHLSGEFHVPGGSVHRTYDTTNDACLWCASSFQLRTCKTIRSSSLPFHRESKTRSYIADLGYSKVSSIIWIFDGVSTGGGTSGK